MGHWTGGLNPRGKRRTSADGELWAYRDYGRSRESLLESMMQEGEVNHEAIASLDMHTWGDAWQEENQPDGWGLMWCTGRVEETCECMPMTGLGEYAGRVEVNVCRDCALSTDTVGRWLVDTPWRDDYSAGDCDTCGRPDLLNNTTALEWF